MSNTERGILTPSDREFLHRGENERKEELSPSARSQRWKAIRQRVQYGMRDLDILYLDLPDDQRRRAMGEFDDRYPIPRVLTLGVPFLMAAVIETTNDEPDDEEFYSALFEGLIEKTIHKIAGVTGAPEQITVDVTINGWTDPRRGFASMDPQKLGRALTEQDLRMLLFADEITSEEFAEAIQWQQDNGDTGA